MSVRLLLEGPDLQEILGQAREAYGPTVRVVQAEQVRSGGLGGFFAKQHYEVTVEVQNPGAGAPSTGGASRKTAAPGTAAVSSQNDQALASAQARVAAARAAAFSAADLAAVDDVLAAASYEDGPAPARPAADDAAPGGTKPTTVPTKSPRWRGERPRTRDWCRGPRRKPADRPSWSPSCPESMAVITMVSIALQCGPGLGRRGSGCGEREGTRRYLSAGKHLLEVPPQLGVQHRRAAEVRRGLVLQRGARRGLLG